MHQYHFCLGDSLDKIFPGRPPKDRENPFRAGCFAGERTAFQIAYTIDYHDSHMLEEDIQFEIKTPPGMEVKVFRAALVPSAYPCSGLSDDDYLTKEPGMFPDVLVPLPASTVRAVPGQWRALWVQICIDRDMRPGNYAVTVSVSIKDGEILWKREAEIMVHSGKLPAQRLIHTEWLHADCLADYYGVPVFSEQHWQILKKFVTLAAESGINMILTPLFTPPMDTAVGGERTTVQLVDAELTEEGWKFGFSRLGRWISMCRECGIVWLEMAPLFTQWGAAAAPKIMALKEGRQQQVFGWDTDAAGEEYRFFLMEFLPRLKAYLQKKDVLEHTWFHVSDEPGMKDLDSYRSAVQCMHIGLGDCRFLDALSDFEFYRLGLVEHPVVASDHLEPFLEAEIPDLWTYYCCVQGVDVSNRFFAMPSGRNRILGIQLYLYRMQGFLQWGYNFYNTRFSLQHIDPFAVTDSGESFPSGDAFLVYPGPDGHPFSSIRLEVLRDAMEDLRALEALEQYTSRDSVEALIRETAGMDITFKRYPKEHDFLLRLRGRVNREISLNAERTAAGYCSHVTVPQGSPR